MQNDILCNIDSFDNYNEENDDSLISRNSIFSLYPNTEESENNIDNSFNIIPCISFKNEVLSDKTNRNNVNNKSKKFSIYSSKKRGRKIKNSSQKISL